MAPKLHVVILGGGFAGLESAFLLKTRLRDEVHVTVISDRPSFLFRPDMIYLPFGADREALEIPLTKPTDRRGIHLIVCGVERVDPLIHTVFLRDGRHLYYDRLVVATGATVRPEEIPGLAEFTHPIWTVEQMLELRQVLDRVKDKARAGKASHLLFLNPQFNRCPGPLYELAFMFETHLRRLRIREKVEISLATAERGYMEVFGTRMDKLMEEEFRSHGMRAHRDHQVDEVQAGRVRFAGGSILEFDEAVSFPPHVAAVDYDGLLRDERGFLTTELHSRGVLGVDGVYAPGDAGDFPVKQGYLAFIQAEVVAEEIVSEFRRVIPRTTFNPISMCLLDQLDRATFAQAPLRMTGDPISPVEVRHSPQEPYKIGVSPAWRFGRKMLGFYVPMRFRAGEPFYAGIGWQMMEAGLKGMTSVFAETGEPDTTE